MQDTFRAFVVNRTEDTWSADIKTLTAAELPEGNVTVRVAYSSVNYKDAMAASPNNKVVKAYPMVPGIDLAGTVAESSDARFKPGDPVIATGYELGISHWGGYSELVRMPADWLVPLPSGLSLREAMALGTAGFTAALSIHRLEQNGLTPGSGPVLVTGASGGVGSLAVAMLTGLGYEVAASTGKDAEHDYLRQLGAGQILHRSELTPDAIPPLQRQRWAGAVDAVGGKTLAFVLGTVRYGGSVAVSGVTGGADVATTVYPFILRGVNLLGIDSVYCPMDTRLALWKRLAGDLKPKGLLEGISQEITLDELPKTLERTLGGTGKGRTIVKLSER
ncbi:acryloyl-CoA reductase [Paenibacillus allorhizosphaerae]|uniref:Quinone oxidoreductase YhfP n=1 Tax=Paenibacillus allorhizosphaerae TaxID=2849866 RepID=A0ABM8VHZ0_9BACL|nr:acryloyl-CoA reductase [Paenibacillus allorhizosphaerae]CAG7643284.1 Putative quinone oxidoreductase YhfP [Paenibacillus allorhizosphaerae]